MNIEKLGDESWRWYLAMTEAGDRPICITCGVSLIYYHKSFVVRVSDLDEKLVFHGLEPLICRECAAFIDDEFPDPCTFEELKIVTNAVERISAREEAFRRDKEKRVGKKRRKNTSSEKTEDRSRKKSKRTGQKIRRKVIVRRPKNSSDSQV